MAIHISALTLVKWIYPRGSQSWPKSPLGKWWNANIRTSTPIELMAGGTVTGKSYVDPVVVGKILDQVVSKQEQPRTLITEKLTGREVEVLRLIAHGFSNSEIAERLHLSEGTVRNHVSSIFSKLDVSDRTQAAILAIRHGLDK